jgi:hypothetical protein
MRGPCRDGVVLLAAPEKRIGPPVKPRTPGSPAGNHDLDRTDLPPPGTAKRVGETHTHRTRIHQPGRAQRPKTTSQQSRGSPIETRLGHFANDGRLMFRDAIAQAPPARRLVQTSSVVARP